MRKGYHELGYIHLGVIGLLVAFLFATSWWGVRSGLIWKHRTLMLK
jgi:hypothetical protein